MIVINDPPALLDDDDEAGELVGRDDSVERISVEEAKWLAASGATWRCDHPLGCAPVPGAP